MTTVPNTFTDDAKLTLSAPSDKPVGVASPPASAQPAAPEVALSTAVTTSTAGGELLEAVAVIATGAAIALIAAVPLGAGGAAIIAAGAFLWARKKRINRAKANEEELRAKRYVFSSEQLATASRSELPPEVAGALRLIQPDEPLSRWELSFLLASHMGEGRAGEVLPLVMRFARRASDA